VIASAALLGLAVAVLLARPPARRRLDALGRPERPVGPAAGRGLPPSRPLCLATGFVLWWLLGGPLGVATGAAVALLGPRFLDRLDDTAQKEQEQLARQLPLALDLLGACLAGGGPLSAALSSVAAAVEGPCGRRLQRVAAALAVGTPPEDAFRELGSEGPAGSAGRALCRASEGGTPVAAVVTRVAADARRTAVVEARKRAKRAGVLAVGPLGACFLPAFFLIGVAPAVAGLVGPLLHSF
jgi:pilus assembly protein TadC